MQWELSFLVNTNTGMWPKQFTFIFPARYIYTFRIYKNAVHTRGISWPPQTFTDPLCQHNQFGIISNCHYNEQVTWGHTYNHSQTPCTILVFLYVKSVQMEQYHLYKTHMHSYAIVYSCIQKWNKFTIDIRRCRFLHSNQWIRHYVKDYTDR